MKLPINTAVVVPVNVAPLTDDTDFKTRETAVAYNASGMDLVWNFQAPNGTITQTAVTPTTAGVHDWAHLGDGMYTMELPASGGTVDNDTVGYGWWSGIATGVLAWRGPTVEFVTQESLWESNYGQLPYNERGGRVWYVAASGGSSSNPGTQNYPLDTIATALSSSNFGDTIILLGSHTTAINLSSNPGLTIEGGEGSSLTVASGSAITCSDYTTLRNLTVTSSNGQTIHAQSDKFVTLDRCNIVGTMDGIYFVDSENCHINRCKIYGDWDAANLSGCIGMTVEDSEFFTDGSYDVDFESRAIFIGGDKRTVVTIRNCYLHGRRTVSGNYNIMAIGVDADSEGTSIRLENTHLVATSTSGVGDSVCIGGGDTDNAIKMTLVGCSLYATSSSATAYSIKAATAGSHVVLDSSEVIAGTINGPSNVYRIAVGSTITNLDDLDTAQDSQHSTTQSGIATAMSAIGSLSIPSASDIRTEIDNNSAQLTSIAGDTNELQTDLTDGGRLDLLIDEIKSVTDLLVASHSEPTGVPAANETPLDKLAYLFMAFRNKVEVTGAKKIFHDDSGNAEWEKDLSDNGTTYSESKANAI